MSCFERSCCVSLQFENQAVATLVCCFIFSLTLWFWTVNLFLPCPAQPLQISLPMDCVILISLGRTPQCRCYSSPPPPVISGFNLTSFDLFTYVMWNVSGSLPSPSSPPVRPGCLLAAPLLWAAPAAAPRDALVCDRVLPWWISCSLLALV